MTPVWLRILDLRTGKSTNAGKVIEGDYDEVIHSLWLGTSHRFALIDSNGNISAGEVSRGKLVPVIEKWKLTKNGGCSDLRYVRDRGIYFIQKIGKITRAYYSNDLRTLSKAPLLPIAKDKSYYDPYYDQDIPEGRVYSPDNALYATVEAGKAGKPGMIKVYDKSGHCVDIARGTKPSWKGASQY